MYSTIQDKQAARHHTAEGLYQTHHFRK